MQAAFLAVMEIPVRPTTDLLVIGLSFDHSLSEIDLRIELSFPSLKF